MTLSRYEELRLPSGTTASVARTARRLLSEVDVLVFDCDGTLVDVRESYDMTILKTVNQMMREFAPKKAGLDERSGRGLILKIRQTGGFNSDWDTTYALCLFLLVASGAGREEEPPPATLTTSKRTRGADYKGTDEDAIARLAAIVEDFSSSPRPEGWMSVDAFLKEERKPQDVACLKAFKAYLGYPGNPLASRMTLSFDRTYYGDELFARIYGKEPKKARWGKGLIENEKVMITRDQLGTITRIIGGRRLAIATGRAYVSVQHTLGPLLDAFQRDASVFIGDGDIYPDLAPELERFRKPSGASLSFAQEQLDGRVLLYIGDSGEDRMMVDDARKKDNVKALFAGVYGTAYDKENQRAFFLANRSDVVMESVGQLGDVLTGVKN